MREICVICDSSEPSHQGGLCPEHAYDDEPDTRAENVCMHDVSMRDECRACYAIYESQHDALVQAVDSLADLDPCRDDTYHLDEE